MGAQENDSPNAGPRLTRREFSALAVGTALAAATGARSQTPGAEAIPPYKNPALPFKERIADLVGRMTPEEKAEQIQMTVPNNARLGIPGCCWWSESLHGVSRADPATIYPTAIGMAAAWNPDLMHKIAVAISDEARAMYRPNTRYYGLTLWCPTINMARDPRWGRCQETYGEDPHLTARLAVAFCKGLQGDDPKYLKTAATPKHFAAHSQETGRFNKSFDVSERDLREYYLPAFRACFVEAKAASVMTAHSGINGTPGMVNAMLMKEILRNEWGFDGAVTTDWSSLRYLIQNFRYAPDEMHGCAVAIKAGIDVIAQEPSQAANTLNALTEGVLAAEDLDRAVSCNLSVRMRLGLFDPEVMQKFSRPRSVIGSKEHIALTLQAARESIVLLHNEPAKPGFGFEKLLPLDLRRVHSIAVLGPFADTLQFGDYTPKPTGATISPLDGIKAAVGPRVKVVTADWADIDETVAAATASDVVILVMGNAEGEAREGIDKPTLVLPRQNVLVKIMEANPITVLVLEANNPLGLEWVKQNVPAALMLWYPGEQGGTALAEVLFGKYNPAGRLPMTFYRAIEDLPPQDDYQVDKGRTYMYHEKPVPYVFGHGLSYTTFAYSNLQVRPTAKGVATIAVSIANTGPRDGDEVVQLYVHQRNSTVKRPIKQLKGFQRIPIAAGKSANVQFSLPLEELAFWNMESHQFMVEPGTYDILVGASSGDIRLQGLLTV